MTIGIDEFVSHANLQKRLFTPGPASLIVENIMGLKPCFGRGDIDFETIENKVLHQIKKMAGQEKIVRMQGSATLALEIAILNFLYGKVLLVSTGFYSSRLHELLTVAKDEIKSITHIDVLPYNQIRTSTTLNYDWVVACSTETSCGLRLPIPLLGSLAKNANAKLFLDATASIGLENNHEVADITCFSSCKGLFGLTGAGFIAYNGDEVNEVKSFNLRLNTHVEKKVTGPLHSICSLSEVLPNHDDFRSSVIMNKEYFLKKFKEDLFYSEENQPLLCTRVNRKLTSLNPNVILYSPRVEISGSVVCHLGEVHLGRNSTGSIIEELLPQSL